MKTTLLIACLLTGCQGEKILDKIQKAKEQFKEPFSEEHKVIVSEKAPEGVQLGIKKPSNLLQQSSSVKKVASDEGSAVMAMCTFPNAALECSTFVDSLRKTGYTGAIVLGVSDEFIKSPASNDFIQKYGVTPKVVTSVPCPHMGTCAKVGDSVVPAALARFAEQKQWMQEGKYTGYVMTADSRDVFFQAHPFAHLKWNMDTPVVEAASEHGWDSAEDRKADAGKMAGSTIGYSGFTRGWIGNCMGPEAAAALKEQNVLCSGTTLGTAKGMELYLTLMADEISKRAPEKEDCQAYGVDQGFHNFLLHNIEGKGLMVEKPEYGEGTISTIGNICSPPPSKEQAFKERTGRDHSWDGEEMVRDKEGYVLREDGTRVPVVHQYDRCFKQFVEEGWINKVLLQNQ